MSKARQFIEKEIREIESENKPRYILAAERLAKRRGISPEEFMESISRRMKETIYPTRECLSPDEIIRYREPYEIPEKRRSHLDQCMFCATLIDAEPAPEKIKEVVEAIASW